MAIYPNKEQIEELLKGPADQPVVMVNLLKFKERADESEGDTSGQVAYGRYAEQMRKANRFGGALADDILTAQRYFRDQFSREFGGELFAPGGAAMGRAAMAAAAASGGAVYSDAAD